MNDVATPHHHAPKPFGVGHKQELITDAAVSRIAELGARALPYEACGILLPPCFNHSPHCMTVVELPNEAHKGDLADPRLSIGPIDSEAKAPVAVKAYAKTVDPRDAYVLDTRLLWDALENYLQLHPEQLIHLPDDPDDLQILQDGFFIWHTHPNGFLGPSHGDMQYRVPGLNYLVVSLGETPVAVQY